MSTTIKQHSEFRRAITARTTDDHLLDVVEAREVVAMARKNIQGSRSPKSEAAYYTQELRSLWDRGLDTDSNGLRQIQAFLDDFRSAPKATRADEADRSVFRKSLAAAAAQGQGLLNIGGTLSLLEIARENIRNADDPAAAKRFYAEEFRALPDRDIDTDGNSAKQIQAFLDECR